MTLSFALFGNTVPLNAPAGTVVGRFAPTVTPGADLSSHAYGTAFALTADTDFITADGAIVKTLGGTFADLQAQVLDYLDRPELAVTFPIWIRLFQSKLNRLLRVGGSEAQAVLTPDPLTGGCSLPNDYQAWRTVRSVNAWSEPLEYATPDMLASGYMYGCAGIPRQFTIKGTTLFPMPAAPVNLTYYRGVPIYLSGVLNDWLLLAHFDLYLYGVLTEAEMFLKNDERAAMWQQQTAAALADLQSADRDARWGRSRVMSAEAMP